MDSLAFTARERRYRMVAIRGHIWGTCMSWRPKRGQRSRVHGAKRTDGSVHFCHCRVESKRGRMRAINEVLANDSCRHQSKSFITGEGEPIERGGERVF